MNPDERPHLAIFDPLRGFLAFWVYAGHLSLLTTGDDHRAAVAVDIFMFVSGFLMFYIWNVEGPQPGNGKTVASFYVRRFFRIAPLYYLVLAPALMFSWQLARMSHALNEIFPPTWGVVPQSPDYSAWISRSPQNAISRYPHPTVSQGSG